MDVYDPEKTPDSIEWLELDEDARIDLVQAYHADANIELPDAMLHAAIHVVVENQLALDVDPVSDTLERLQRQGLDRHEAIHAVGAVLSEDIASLLGGGQGQWNHNRYESRLNKLTAKRWQKGKW